jgi:hypothetical protein
VNAVLANTATDHDNTIPRRSKFDMCWLAPNVRRHQAPGTAKHQGFAEKALVKYHRAIHIWDTALIGAILNTAMHALEHPLRMQ